MDASWPNNLLSETLNLAVMSSVFFEDDSTMHFGADIVEVCSASSSSNRKGLRQARGDSFLQFGSIGIRNGKPPVATKHAVISAFSNMFLNLRSGILSVKTHRPFPIRSNERIILTPFIAIVSGTACCVPSWFGSTRV